MTEAFSVLDVHGGGEYNLPDIFRMVGEQYAKGARLRVGGILCHSLVPFWERERRLTTDIPKLHE
ncbi:hypothetical protein ACXYUI_29145, partial [Klebsiella pneumoniae]